MEIRQGLEKGIATELRPGRRLRLILRDLSRVCRKNMPGDVVLVKETSGNVHKDNDRD